MAPQRPGSTWSSEGERVNTDAIRRRMSETTPGPWLRHGADVHAADRLLFRGRDGSSEVRRQADRDAEFVAHAREDIAALLDALDRTAADAASAPAAGTSIAP